MSFCISVKLNTNFKGHILKSAKENLNNPYTRQVQETFENCQVQYWNPFCYWIANRFQNNA